MVRYSDTKTPVSADPDAEFLAELVRLTPPGGWPLGQIILTADEASRYLGVQSATLRQWLRRGRIVRHGRDRYDMGSVMNRMVEDARRVAS